MTLAVRMGVRGLREPCFSDSFLLELHSVLTVLGVRRTGFRSWMDIFPAQQCEQVALPPPSISSSVLSADTHPAVVKLQ